MKYNVNGNTDGVREAMLARLERGKVEFVLTEENGFGEVVMNEA